MGGPRLVRLLAGASSPQEPMNKKSRHLPQHSSSTNEHYTPLEIINAARSIMGEIDLDPASCALANKNVHAKAYFTRDDDGLTRPWGGRVFLNPPGGKRDGHSVATAFWNKLVGEYDAGRVYCAFFVVFNPNLLFTSQDSTPALKFPVCFPRRRLSFLGVARSGELEAQDAPPHHNALVFLPPRDADYWNALHRFFYYCRELGWTGMARSFQESDFSPAAPTT